MAKFFSIDSKVAQILSRVWDLFLLNLLFILGSLPVLTFGVSAAAAYSVATKIVEDCDDGVVLAYFRAFKANLRQGLLLSVLHIFFIAAAVANFALFEIVEGNPIGFLILGMICAVLVFVHFFYVYALTAKYRGSIYRHLTNSRSIFIRFFGRSLLCTVLVAFEVWLFFFNGWLLLYIGVFLAPVLVITTISAFAIKIFQAIEAENEMGEG